MANQAAVGRITPYEVVFAEGGLAERGFPAVAEEAGRRGASCWRYEYFASLEAVVAMLEGIVPEEAERAAVDQYLQILYHGYHFWEAGCPLYAFEEPVLRSLIESAPDLRGWAVESPRRSLYCEVPRNLFWAQATADGPPEPLEGFFVTRGPERPSAELDLLLALGLRSDRPGFSVVGLRLDPGQALELHEAESFRSDIPGAELAGLYSLRRYSEAALLALRLLWYLEAYPASLAWVEGAGPERESRGRAARTRLSHFRVSLIERSCG